MWMDYRNIPNINIIDPVRKDTIVVPYGGYSIIRIWATNPGVWFLHCHIDRHMLNGMALMLNESFEMIGDLPKEMPTCHSFRNVPLSQRSTVLAVSSDTNGGLLFLIKHIFAIFLIKSPQRNFSDFHDCEVKSNYPLTDRCSLASIRL